MQADFFSVLKNSHLDFGTALYNEKLKNILFKV